MGNWLNTHARQGKVRTPRRAWAKCWRWDAGCSLATFASVIALSPAVSSASAVVELKLDAPPGCPSPLTIEQAIERLVQHAPATPLRVAATLVPLPGRWQLRAAFESGKRVVNGDTCMAVAEALIVIAALAIDPSGKLDASVFHDLERAQAAQQAPASALAEPLSGAEVPVQPGSTARSNATEPRGGPTPNLQTSPPRFAVTPLMFAVPNAIAIGGNAPAPNGDSAAGPRTDRARFGATLLMLAERGMLPDWSLGPSVAAHYGRRGLWAEFSAASLVPRFKSVGNGSAIGGQIGWFSAQLGGCTLPLEHLPLGGCLAAEFGDLLGRGEHVPHQQTAYAFVPAVLAAIVWRATIHNDFGLEARLGLAALGIRPRLGLEGYGPVFQPAPVSWRGVFGFSWR